VSLTNHLPDGWSAATLADVGVWSSGGTPSKKRPEYHGGDIPWVLTGDLDDGPLIEIPNSITCAGLKNSSAKLFPDGTLLMAMYGATIGKLAVLRHEAATNQACAALLPSKANQNSLKYVYYFLLAKREGFKKAGKGGAQPNISQTVIKETPIAVAPLNEQLRIVEKIETLFARLDKGEEAVRDVQKLLTRYRQSVLKSAVTGQLTADWRAKRVDQLEHGHDLLARILETGRESWDGRGKYKAPDAPDTAELPDLPTGWVWASVDQLARIMGGLTKNSKRKEMSMTRPMLRVANVYQNRLELDDIHETGITEGELARVSLQARDILVVEGNGSKSQIGRMAVWSDEIPNAVHQNHLIKVRLHEAALAEFMVAWFQSPIGRQVVEKVASSTSGLYTLSISKIAAMVAPLPSLEEVDEIVRGVEEAHSKIAVLEEWCETELKRSASLRQSILKDAFAGKLVPQDPTDEPASALLARIAAEKPTAKKPRRKTSA
jgi:type I restriction enzyme, S subunit